MNQGEHEETEKLIYLAFNSPKSSLPAGQPGLFNSAFLNIVKFAIRKFIPKANPDYESLFDDVASWLVECVEESGEPQREIGLDINGYPIMKMPYRNNCGYWTDNNLSATDFINHFNAIETTPLLFENMWLQFK